MKKLTEELELSRRERETEASTSPEVVQERACECVQKIEHLTATFNRKEVDFLNLIALIELFQEFWKAHLRLQCAF